MKSKKSKSSSKRRDRSRSPSDDGKSKRSRARSKSGEKRRETNTKGSSRKSRWQEHKAEESKKAQKSAASAKGETSAPMPRIKDLLNDKEKIVDLLFSSITGKSFQELVPAYLEKKSKSELKKLCLEQLNSMSDDVILMIISGQSVSNADESKAAESKEVEKVEKEENTKTEKTVAPAPKEDETKSEVPEKKPEESSVVDAASEATSLDLLELHTTATDESILDEESEIPLVIKDEVAKDLITPERDAELQELEMRARAIRSLLKARSQVLKDDDDRENDDSKGKDSDAENT